MQSILLPGFSKHNRDWAIETQQELAKRGVELEFLAWTHWKSGNPADFDLANEAKRVDQMTNDKKIRLVAKSIGTLVTTEFIKTYKKIPEKIIFLGIPIYDFNFDNKGMFIYVLREYPELNLTVIQNEHDNHGSYQEVVQFLKKSNRELNIVKADRRDHEYPYYDLIHRFLTQKD